MRTTQTFWRPFQFAAITSFLRVRSRAARKATLVLFAVAVLLAGSAATVRGQSALDGLIDSQPSLAVGLVAHYTFDEQCTNSTPGCVQDSSGLGNNGTLGSATSGTLPQAPIWTANGRFAGAYLYNGIVQPGQVIATIGEGIYLPQGVDVDGNWTLSVWAKLNNVTNHTSGTIYSQKQSTEDCRNLLIHWEGDADQTMTLQVRDSACHELILHNLPSNPMVAGQWYHLVGVGNNRTYSFYINGVLQQSQLVSNMGSLSSDSHTIGTMFDNGGLYYNHYLNGSVDEMRIYSRALSATEILALSPVSISGTIFYCSNPVPGLVPDVTLTLTGSASDSTLSDGSGHYMFSSLASGGSYIVTPIKAARMPGSTGIDTLDVVATQRHFLGLTLLTGCRLTAADVTGDGLVTTSDVVAIQRFFLGLSTGIANAGKYKFNPVSRSYTPLVSNQTAQNYDTLVFGDVASPFTE